MRGLLITLAALLQATAAGYCLAGTRNCCSDSERRLRFCLGEVGVMTPTGLAGRALEFEYLLSGLRLGAAAAEGLGGLSSDVSGAVAPVHLGLTLVSYYEPEFGAATRLRELSVEVGAGLRPTWPLSPLWRGSVRGVADYCSVGLGIEAGVIVIGASGNETATPYAALLIQLPTLVIQPGY